MKKSKVKFVTGNGHFDGSNGRLYKFNYEMEDGTHLEANHKSETCPFKAGDDVEYEITRTHDTYGNSGKVKKPDSGSFGGGGGNSWYGSPEHLKLERFRQKAIIIQSSLSNAIQYHHDAGDLTHESVKATADIFYQFVIDKATAQ